MVSFKNLFLAGVVALGVSAAATPKAVEATPAQIAGFRMLYTDLIHLDQSVKKLTAAIKLYRSGVQEAKPILDGVAKVNAANRKAFDVALVIPVLNVTQSWSIVKYVKDPLAIDIPIAGKALESKKAPLVGAGLKKKILEGLELLEFDHESLSVAIGKKLAPITLPAAAAPVAVIDASIREAIAYFAI